MESSKQTKRATKICSKCLSKKSIKQFYKDRATKDGLRSDCKPCHDVNARKASHVWEANNRPKRRLINIKFLYGLSADDYVKLLFTQGFACAECHVPFSKDINPEVDHRHDVHEECKGKKSCLACLRGIVCHPCNILRLKRDRAIQKQRLSKVAA
jgi:hypothetical protein